ncbi:MAG: FAD-dependent oxidoreductase [Rhizomicrobium sp.]
MADSFDVIVMGSGPGGYVCAIRAAQLGLKTAIVERDKLGGICLNWGCIPTKALLRSSEIWHLMHRLNEFGFSADNLKFDIAKIVERSRKVAQQLSSGVAFLMKKHKITVIAGEAKLAGRNKLIVTKDERPPSTRPRTSCSPPARAPAPSPAWSRTENSSGPIAKRWCRRPSRSRS